jgi:penicillin-binding protein 1A
VPFLRRRKDSLRKPRRRIRKLRVFLLLFAFGILGFGAFVLGVIRAISEEIPKLDPAYQQRLAKNGYITTPDGTRNLAVIRGRQSRVIVKSNQISPLMKQAIVAIEDQRFFQHHGVDVRGVVRAVWADIRNKSVVQGGSTITQQFIKNAYVHSAPSITRKLKEAALAWQLEQRWSKDRILSAYLNTIYFGNGAYGVQQASQVYYGHSAKTLNLPQAALLAGIPQNPSRYDPVANPKASRARRRQVLEKMYELGDITHRELRWASSAALPKPDRVHLPGIRGPEPAQHFVNYVKQQLVDRCGSSQVFGGGLRIRTSIDLDLQKIARKSIAKWLRDPNGPSAALAAVDARDGRVLAMVGGNNFYKSQFNLAVQGERQPGSSFKPFVLTTALEDGISPDTEFVSKPVAIPAGDRVWVVNNYEGAYLGTINLTTATAYSDNSVFAQLTNLVGPRAIVETAHRLGITSPLRSYFSIGLGAQAVNPLEMARSFAVFADGGYRLDGSITGDHARAVLSVANGSRGCRGANEPVRRRAVSPETAAIVDSLLQRVVSEGTGRRAALPDGRPVAGKTGTTENYGDAWFVGYTPQLVAAVWVGYPNKLRPMLTEFHGDPVAGGTYPALIWRSFMQAALDHLHEAPAYFPAEPSTYGQALPVVQREGRIMVDNGNCQLVRSVVFLPAVSAPRTADCKPNEVEVPNVVGQTVEQARARLAQQPLKTAVVYRPAAPLERPGVVLRQFPRSGTLSSYDKVTLVLAKPMHGVVPSVIGVPLGRARHKLGRLKLESRVVKRKPGRRPGRVLFQAPKGGVAAAPGMLVRLVVTKRGLTKRGGRVAASAGG